MDTAPSGFPDADGQIAAPPELAERAVRLVEAFPECFWSWRPDARVQRLCDVRLVIKHLRKYGGWHAWRAAQELHVCLLPHFKKTS